MVLKDLLEKLNLTILNEADLSREVNGCYIGDLLSNVMANAKENQIWLTIQGHQNIIAVSLLAEVSAVIVVENSEVDEKSIKRAEEKGVNLLKSELTAYKLAKRLAELGV
ncbi:MAG: serine kinase [Halanaerobiales bacterium]|nr:serine kinase [Halanaerobiales bacterium]